MRILNSLSIKIETKIHQYFFSIWLYNIYILIREMISTYFSKMKENDNYNRQPDIIHIKHV